MKTIKILIMVLSLSVMYQFASAQNCPGNKVRMSQGLRGCGCNNCTKTCVAPADTAAYLANGWYFGNCSRFCCLNWIRTGEVIPGIETSLTDIYPNPASGSATVSFSLSQTQKVSFKLFDMTGRLVSTLEDEIFEEGENEFLWNASGVNAGIYFLKMNAGSDSETKKISVIK